MVLAWYMNDDPDEDQRSEHHKNPKVFVKINDLHRLSGVEYFYFPTDDGDIFDFKEKRGYNYSDELVVSRDTLPDYDEKLRIFYQEHLHTDEEIRFVIEGSGYFDVRDINDKWIRIYVTPGDLLILPSGIYHRFTLDNNNYIKARRYFIGHPVWTAHNRPADHMECRKKYLENNELFEENNTH